MILDTFDKSILRALARDGRMTHTALGERVNLSPNAVAERIKRLQRDGVIEGFSVRLSPGALGKSLLVFIEVKLDRTTSDVFDAFSQAAARTEEIEECHMVAGGFDYLIKTRHANMAAFRRFLSDTLLSLPGIRETHTYAVMEEVKASQPQI